MATRRASRSARTRYVHASTTQERTYSDTDRTSFTAYFAKSASGDDLPERGTPRTPTENTETVLLTEDDDAVRKIVGRMLESAGFVVLTASSAASAERVALEHGRPIDLLLTDVVMPHGSGRELMERLRSRYPAMRVLYMSGYTDDVIIRHGVQLTGRAFMPKPFTRADLTRRIREILDA